MALPQLFSGARGQLTIVGLNGAKTFFFITDVTVTVTNNVRAPHVFGRLNAASTEPLSTSVSVSIGRLIPVNNGQGQAVNTSAIAMGIESTINLMLGSEDIEVQLLDSITGTTVADVKNCRFTGRTLSDAAGNLGSERITLIGIYDAAGGNSAQVGV
jgi:hypothetical protein